MGGIDEDWSIRDNWVQLEWMTGVVRMGKSWWGVKMCDNRGYFELVIIGVNSHEHKS